MKNQNPEFKVYVGCMFGSKSSRVLMEIERYKRQNKKIAVFKPLIDNRYSEAEIVTHMGWRFPAVCVKTGADVLKFFVDSDEQYDVVVVDELFMIPGIADALVWLYKNGYTVIAASIDLSSSGKPFKEVERVISYATYVKKCPAVCSMCDRDAYYTYKKTEDNEEISVGGEEKYEPRCYRHHPLINQQFDSSLEKDTR